MLQFKVDNTAQIKPERETQLLSSSESLKKTTPRNKNHTDSLVGSIFQAEKKTKQLANEDTLICISHCSVLDFF